MMVLASLLVVEFWLGSDCQSFQDTSTDQGINTFYTN